MSRKPRDYSKGPTRREREVLAFVRGYIKAHGYPPSVQDIIDGTSVTSTSVVSYYLEGLSEMGYIERRANTARAIRVIDQP